MASSTSAGHGESFHWQTTPRCYAKVESMVTSPRRLAPTFDPLSKQAYASYYLFWITVDRQSGWESCEAHA